MNHLICQNLREIKMACHHFSLSNTLFVIFCFFWNRSVSNNHSGQDLAWHLEEQFCLGGCWVAHQVGWLPGSSKHCPQLREPPPLASVYRPLGDTILTSSGLNQGEMLLSWIEKANEHQGPCVGLKSCLRSYWGWLLRLGMAHVRRWLGMAAAH